MSEADAILQAAEEVVTVLRAHRVEAVVIGAVALAAFHYVRYTEDVDLGVNADLPTLRVAMDALRARGYTVDLREPDATDPLGGVMDVSGPFGLVQVISYAGRFPAVIDDAVRLSRSTVKADSPLRLVPLPQLIALKLYAGGHKSKADIVELLARNPDLDLDEVRRLCNRYCLSGLDELIDESGAGSGPKNT
jgi:hypothetical protein